MTTRHEIEALGKHDPLIRSAIWRAYANEPDVKFASPSDKWASVLQDLVAVMYARNKQQEASIMRYARRYGTEEPIRNAQEIPAIINGKETFMVEV